jgi:hypothetical protein
MGLIYHLDCTNEFYEASHASSRDPGMLRPCLTLVPLMISRKPRPQEGIHTTRLTSTLLLR